MRFPLCHIDTCLLYTSDAADDMQCVDLGGRRIIKKSLETESGGDRGRAKMDQTDGCFFQAEDGIRDVERSRGLGDVYKRQDILYRYNRHTV